MLAELKNIHRLRERILESSRDNSGHINMVMLVDRLFAFGEQEDDMTLMLVKRK